MSLRGFGAKVRIKSTPLTESMGLAGLEGETYGFTTPSTTGVGPIVGEDKNDYAVNVYFVELKKSHWFIKELLEFVDHNAGFE